MSTSTLVVRQGSQAEWIVERDEACGVSCTFPSLNNFGLETISDAAAFVNGSGQYLNNIPNVQSYIMVSCDGGQTLLAYPNPPTASNPGTFSVQWFNYGNSDNPNTCNP